MSPQTQTIALRDDWLYDDGSGALVEVSWPEALKHAATNVRARFAHNTTGIELTRAQARRFDRAPQAALVPHCSACGASMELRGGKYGAFFYCTDHTENRKNGGSCVVQEQ